MIVSVPIALVLQAAAPAVPAQTQPVRLPPTYVAGVKKCLAALPDPSGKLYANLAELGRGLEADAAMERLTTGTAGTYSTCLTDLEDGVDSVSPVNAEQQRQVRFTRADVKQRIADSEKTVRSIIAFSRDAFAEQPARYWADLPIGGSDTGWLDHEPKSMPTLVSKCGTFKIGEALLRRYEPAVTNATLKRMYAYRDCVDSYSDELYSESRAIGDRLRAARLVSFYAPYVCGVAPPNHCIDRARWQAVSDKLKPARAAKLTAMAAHLAPELDAATKADDDMDRYVEYAETKVKTWNEAGK